MTLLPLRAMLHVTISQKDPKVTKREATQVQMMGLMNFIMDVFTKIRIVNWGCQSVYNSSVWVSKKLNYCNQNS